MGMLPTQPEPTIHHFSHPHPLHLTTTHQHQAPPCSACHLPTSSSSSPTYTCQICPNFSLHLTCSQLPQKINHPFHQHHTFSLLPTPAYPDGQFRCDACGRQGSAFSYHCKPCGIDLHVTCAATPLSLFHHSHLHHRLALVFSPPYHNKSFSCDLCGGAGSDHWLYRCASCDFDAHLGCANAKPAGPGPVQTNFQMQQFQTPLITQVQAAGAVQPIQMQQYQTPSRFQAQIQPIQMQNLPMPSRFQPVGTQFAAPGTPYVARPYLQNYPPNNISMTMGNQGGLVQAPGTPYAARPYLQNYPPNNIPMSIGNQGGVGQNNMLTNQNNALMNQVIEGLVSGAAEAAGQQLFQGLMGGNGSGGSGGGGGFLDGSSFIGVNEGGTSGVDLGGMDGGFQDYSIY